MSTGTTRVAPSPPLAPSDGRSLRWDVSRRWRLALATAITLVLALAGSQAEVPLIAISPGSAVAVAPLVDAGERAIAPDGQVYLITVRVRPLTVAGAMQGWLDPDVEVLGRNRVAPSGLQPFELRQLNLDQMETSKLQALGVALEELGHDAITGKGAAVVQLVPGLPVERVLAVGDTITEFAGRPVTAHHDVLEAVHQLRPGSSAELVVEASSGEPRRVTLTLVSSPDDPETAFLGATLQTRGPRLDFPFEVDIASDRIGGPSAGLAFTLEILDVLTPGELTGDRRVAATGTIELDGSVGPVGGLAQKTAAATAAGIELLLVPTAEADEARRRAGDRLSVEPVASLDEALRVLVDDGGDPLPRCPRPKDPENPSATGGACR